MRRIIQKPRTLAERSLPRFVLATLVADALLLAVTAVQAATPEQACKSGKNKTAGKYAACRENAEAKLAAGGELSSYSYAIGKCVTNFSAAWQKLEGKAQAAGASCPAADSTIKDLTDVYTNTVAALIGEVVSDQTVSDNVTGLEWEKKQNKDDSPSYTNPHDADNVYRWCLDASHDANCDTPGYPPDGTVFTDFLVRLNTTPCFAGHCDWRLPTLVELQTILLPSCPGYPDPCIDAVFGPTFPAAYWTSTNDSNPAYAWTVYFGPGTAFPDSKTYWGDGTYVRAVRTGP